MPCMYVRSMSKARNANSTEAGGSVRLRKYTYTVALTPIHGTARGLQHARSRNHVQRKLQKVPLA